MHIGGKKLAVYQYFQDHEPVAENALFSMGELIIFSDKEEDAATEKEPMVLLKSFLYTLPPIRYFITEDNEYQTTAAYDL